MDLKNIKMQIINDNVAIITINRPGVRNALDYQGWQDLKKVILHCENNNFLKALIITGSGEKAFIAGSDINMLKNRTSLETVSCDIQYIVNLLENSRVPIIAAVNGYAWGGGFEIALACDIVIASENASFGFPEVGLGIIPAAGGIQRITKLVGKTKAMEMLLTGKIIDAQEANKICLVSKVVPAEQLIDEATSIAKEILKKAPLALEVAKKIVNAAVYSDLQAGLLLEKMSQSFLYGTEDKVEGLTAFLEKRSPKYKGK